MKAGFALCFILAACVVALLTLPLHWLFGQKEEGKPTASEKRTSVHHEAIKAQPVEIKPSDNADERLFLVRLLDELGSDAPDESLPAEQLQAALGTYVKQITAARDHVRERHLDDELVAAYDKLLATVDAYTAYLVDLGQIDKAVADKLEKDSYQSGYSAGETGAMAGYAFSDNGASTGQSLAAGGVAALGTYLWDSYQKGKERDEAKTQAINAAHGKLSEAVGSYQALCRQTAQRLAGRYGWKPGEAGFDESDAYQTTRTTLLQEGNAKGLVQLEQTIQAQRPRDPFVVQRKTYFQGLEQDNTPASLLKSAKECLQAADLVPSGQFYDRFRADLLCTTGLALERASAQEIGDKSLLDAPNAEAALGVQVWKAALHYQQDFSGELRQHHAWALAMSGDLPAALKEAVSVAGLRHRDTEFAYILACLYSDAGDADNALTWLQEAVVSDGYANIVNIKKEADLATLRAKKPKEVAELTAVRCDWKLDYGMWNDDVEVTNNSSFALTHVTISGEVRPNKKAWKDLTINGIPAGGSNKWVDAVSVPGSKADPDESHLTLHCDQGECQLVLRQ